VLTSDGLEEGGWGDVRGTLSLELNEFVVRPKDTRNNNLEQQGLGPLEKFVACLVPYV
jgi:hypothetical protein